MYADVHPLAGFASPTLTGVLCERVLKVCRVLDVANDLGAKRVTDIDDRWGWKISSPCGNSGLVFLRVERDYASIARVYTNPQRRRQGLARRLIESLLKAADDHGVGLRLYCQPFAVPEAVAGSFAKTDLSSGLEVVKESKPLEWMAEFYSSFGFQPATDGEARRLGLMIRHRS